MKEVKQIIFCAWLRFNDCFLLKKDKQPDGDLSLRGLHPLDGGGGHLQHQHHLHLSLKCQETVLWKHLVNKWCCLGDIVHTECVDPQPLHCRYSSHPIQHAPHLDGTEQDLLGDLLQRIGTEQRGALCSNTIIRVLFYNLNRMYFVSWRDVPRPPLPPSRLFLWFLLRMTDTGKWCLSMSNNNDFISDKLYALISQR